MNNDIVHLKADTFFIITSVLQSNLKNVKSLNDDELKSFINNPLTLNISSHSVQTERAIRDVDSLAQACISEKKRDGMIRAQQKCRNEKKQKKLMK